jgi:D-alanine-D-alanine ligase-like ATP-grasp enzyme
MRLPGRRRTVYVADRVGEYRAYWSAAAASMGADFTPLTDRLWEVRKGAARTRIFNDLVQLDDPVVLAMAGDKGLCYRLADELGIPVPVHGIFPRRGLWAAWRMISEDGHPFVIKPRRNTSSGMGVTVGVTRLDETARAVARAGLRDSSFIAERMVAGETCRLLFLGGEMIHAVRRRGIRVTPDGRASIRALLAADGLAGLTEDRVTALTLLAQDLTVDSVPAIGASVLVRVLPAQERKRVELRTVYDEDITAAIAPGLVAEVRQIVDAVGSEWAGIDILTTDPGRPLSEVGGVLLELNTTPGLHHHCGLSVATKPCDIAVQVLRYALKAEQ